MNEKHVCGFAGCERMAKALDLCDAHYQQRKRGVALRPIAARGVKRPKQTTEGYVLVFDPDHLNHRLDGWILEHVQVVSSVLGRPLMARENVHHKNGIKNDNRPENLELWVSMQPSGQRIIDLIEHAELILATYGAERELHETMSRAA